MSGMNGIELPMRILLMLGSLLALWYLVRYIRKSRVKIEDTLFWIMLMLLLVVLGAFPDIAVRCATWMRVQSPINFVFLLIIFVLLAKQFFLSVRLSQMEIRLTELAQRQAIQAAEQEGTVPRAPAEGTAEKPAQSRPVAGNEENGHE